MIADLVNQITVEVIPAEWELSTIVKCQKGKGDSLERSYIGLKLKDQILKISERIIEKYNRQLMRSLMRCCLVSYQYVGQETPFLSWNSYEEMPTQN